MILQVLREYRPLVAFLIAAALPACGGGGSGPDPETAVSPPPVADDGGGQVPDNLPVADWLAGGFTYADRDADGIPDTHDAWPDNAPLLADQASGSSLSIERAWTDIDGVAVPDTAVEGYLLRLEVAGLPGTADDIWAVFKTTSGLRASKASLVGAGILSTEPHPGSLGVHVVAGSIRGMDSRIHGLHHDQPLLFEAPATLLAGTDVTLYGRNLDSVMKVALGADELAIVSSAQDNIVVRMPEVPAGDYLVASTATEPSNALKLGLRHNVQLRVSSTLALSQGEALRFRHHGTEYRVSDSQPVSIEFSAHRPAVISFDIVSGNNVRSRNRLYVVVWPGESEITVTPESSLFGRMLRIRHLLPELEGRNWGAIRASLERVVPTAAAQDYFAALRAHTAGQAAPPTEDQAVAAVQAYKDIAAQQSVSADKAFAPVAEVPTTVTGDTLDSIIGTTMTYLNLDTEKVGAGAPEGGFIFPESSPGSDYSQVIILRHGASNLFDTKFKSFSGCDYSEDQQAWATVRNASTDPYEKLWPADLCMQVDGLVFVSAAVATPGFRTAEDIFNEAAAGLKPKELVRRHTVPSFLDATHQWGPGGYYLSADSGLPLCHMETCFVEVITSGYGLYKNVPLSANQQQLVDTLRMRMWVEAIVPWMLGLTGFGEEDDDNLLLNGIDVPGCLKDDLMGRLDFLATAEQLATFIRANQDKTGTELVNAIKQGIDLKVSPWVRKYVKSELGTKFVECLNPFKGAEEIQNGVIDKLLDKPAGLSTFLEILEFVQNLGSAALTPEKFVFKLQPRAEVKNVRPRTIDLYDEDASLSIDGDWLIDIDPNAGGSCGGNGWCPTLVVNDALGGANRAVEIPLDASHIGSNPPGCSFACSNLTIPMTELAPLQDLVGGPVDLELAIADPGFGAYPGGKLRIPVPGFAMTLRTRAKIHAIHPPLVSNGDEILVEGSSLDAFGTLANYELRPEQGTGDAYPLDKIEGGLEPDSKVRLAMPADVSVPQGRYLVAILPGDDATAEAPEPVVSELPVLVTDNDQQLVVVGDHGVVKDDHIRVEFLDANGNIVSGQRPITTLSFSLPKTNNGQSDPVYVDGRWWDDQTLDEFGELNYITALIERVRVTCLTESADGTCTWGIRSKLDKLCWGDANGNFPASLGPRPAWSHKVPKGDSRHYYLAPGESTCDQL